MTSIELESVRGGLTAGGAWNGVKAGVNACRNFTNGVAAGAIFGPGAKEDQIDSFTGRTRNDTGIKPGVELGMMANMAMGPVGGAIATIAGSTPVSAATR